MIRLALYATMIFCAALALSAYDAGLAIVNESHAILRVVEMTEAGSTADHELLLAIDAMQGTDHERIAELRRALNAHLNHHSRGLLPSTMVNEANERGN